MTVYIIPVFICLILASCIKKRVPVYDTVVKGADDGLKTLTRILPTMVVILTAVSMLRESGALEFFIKYTGPLFEKAGIPAEVVSMVLLRPVSGSGAFGLLADNITTYGPDSRVGMLSSVIMGSTETTFYTLAVYFGSAGMKDVKRVLPCALIGDAVCVITACLLIR